MAGEHGSRRVHKTRHAYTERGRQLLRDAARRARRKHLVSCLRPIFDIGLTRPLLRARRATFPAEKDPAVRAVHAHARKHLIRQRFNGHG